MVIAAKKTSQVITHMVIAFTIAYAMTGSVVFSGLAIIIEPVINVLLLPFHEKAWAAVRARATSERDRYMKIAAEKVSQTLMHMGVAFAVIYCATGSLAFGGLAAILEPVCNVLLLPIHDRFWDKLELRINSGMHAA
ncbi:putative membrane protein [Massilia sp. UYP32]|jgi:uncharacterized membrane protein|uniref:DUF2061 domain-containing protein n=1 Tax=Massilia TaxID=149698 RepID=UPI001615BAD4|nr:MULTISPECIES: DUF2061 domain-containing protein [Massilia]QYG00096.1 DUF2061 domain-containing protein [Massilia sp. NP310]